MMRFMLIFLLVLISLFTVEMQSSVQHVVIGPFTGLLAKISAALIMPFDSTVLAYGKVLQFGPGGFAVSIEAGCNGVEATIVLIAAVLAFPAPWRAPGGYSIGLPGGTGPEYRADHQPVLHRQLEPGHIQLGSPLPLACPDHARCTHRVHRLPALPVTTRPREPICHCLSRITCGSSCCSFSRC